MNDALKDAVRIRIRNGRGAGEMATVSSLYNSYRLKLW